MVSSLSGTLASSARPLVENINDALNSYANFSDGCPEHLAAAIQHSLLAPGKRLRPLLVLLAAEACGSDNDRAMPAACAVEMVHAYSLIHDDLPSMDDDNMRRGRPSCHAAFGEATAILAGDALLARAFEVLARDLSPAEVAAKCCHELATAAGATRMVGGQADDLEMESDADMLVADGPLSADLAKLQSIHRRKTGAMITVSLRMGALVAQSDAESLAALTTFGNNLGLAFQIVDDLLDIVGDEATLGKRSGKDEGRGKLTFPRLLGVAESRTRSEELIDQACAAIDSWGDRAATLLSLARYVIDRDR